MVTFNIECNHLTKGPTQRLCDLWTAPYYKAKILGKHLGDFVHIFKKSKILTPSKPGELQNEQSRVFPSLNKFNISFSLHFASYEKNDLQISGICFHYFMLDWIDSFFFFLIFIGRIRAFNFYSFPCTVGGSQMETTNVARLIYEKLIITTPQKTWFSIFEIHRRSSIKNWFIYFLVLQILDGNIFCLLFRSFSIC